MDDKTKQANEAFEAMTPEQKRVAIAQDAIAMMDANRLIARTGSFVAVADYRTFSQLGGDVAGDMGQAISNAQCNVCAMGAVFCAAVVLADRFPLIDHRHSNQLQQGDVFSYLERFFDEDQIILIEMAFEQGEGWYSFNDDYDEEKHVSRNRDREMAVKFGEAYGTSEQCLRAILGNIIRNNGTFKPEQDVKQHAQA